MERLSSIAEYKPLFAAAFPERENECDYACQGHSTYERTVVSELAPFDAWIEGNEQSHFRSSQARFRSVQHQGAVLVVP